MKPKIITGDGDEPISPSRAMMTLNLAEEHRKANALITTAPILGAGLTAWMAGVLKGPAIGAQAVDNWASRLQIKASQRSTTDLMARDTAIMLARIDALKKIGLKLQEQGLIEQLPSSFDTQEAREMLFEQVEQALDFAMRANIMNLQNRKIYATEAIKTLREERNLQLTDIETRLALYGGTVRAGAKESIRTILTVPANIAVGAILGLAEILEGACYGASKVIGGIFGGTVAAPFIGVNAMAEILPYAGRIALAITGLGTMIGGAVAIAGGNDITTEQFRIMAAEGFFFGGITGLIVILIAAKASGGFGGGKG